MATSFGLSLSFAVLAALTASIGAIKVAVWTNVTASSFVYPEVDPSGAYGIESLRRRPSLGIAFSGGGLRAAPLAYGWLRALQLVSCV